MWITRCAVALVMTLVTVSPLVGNTQTANLDLGEIYQNATDRAIKQYCKTAGPLRCVKYQQFVITSGCFPAATTEAAMAYEYISRAAKEHQNLDDATDIIGGDDPQIADLAEKIIKAHSPISEAQFEFGILRLCLDNIGVSVIPADAHRPIVKPSPPPRCQDHEAYATKQASPDYPDSVKGLGLGPATIQVEVTVAANGGVLGAAIYKSIGNMAADHAALVAAEQSTYAPRMVNCVATQSDLLVRYDFDL